MGELFDNTILEICNQKISALQNYIIEIRCPNLIFDYPILAHLLRKFIDKNLFIINNTFK
jgi:hypothetical protein